MKIILKEDMEHLGSAGDIVDVRDGYGRNYLIPQQKGIMATEGAVREMERLKKQAAIRAEMSLEAAKELAEKLEATSVTIPARTGEDEKIHGTVTTIQIADALEEKDILVDRRNITLDQDIRALGEYTATVELPGEYRPKVKVWVVREE